MDLNELTSLVNEGLSQREIARRLDTSQTNVRYWLKKHDLVTRKKWVRPPRVCPCGEANQEMFYNTSLKCKRCHNRDTYKRQLANRRRMLDHMGGECSRCGYDRCDAALEAHHLDPAQKDRSWAAMRGWSWDRLSKEIESCVLLCSNCHREHHAGVVSPLVSTQKKG